MEKWTIIILSIAFAWFFGLWLIKIKQVNEREKFIEIFIRVIEKHFKCKVVFGETQLKNGKTISVKFEEPDEEDEKEE